MREFRKQGAAARDNGGRAAGRRGGAGCAASHAGCVDRVDVVGVVDIVDVVIRAASRRAGGTAGDCFHAARWRWRQRSSTTRA